MVGPHEETNGIVTNTIFWGRRIFVVYVMFRFNILIVCSIKTVLGNLNLMYVGCSEMGPGCKIFHFYLDKKQFIVKILRFKL